jgi:RNA polymerase sigma factor (TIGR02999 family)
LARDTDLCETPTGMGPERIEKTSLGHESASQASSTPVLRDAGVGGSTTDLFPVVYQQLRDLAHAKMHREPAGHTLQTTALVHEVFLRLQNDDSVTWQNPRHFFAAAAEAMRRILVERARRVNSLKRGGDKDRVSMDFIDVGEESDPTAMIALDEALTELKGMDPRLAEVVMLRYFSGLSVEETAAAMETSPRTVKRDWSVARAWLSQRLT